MIDDDPQTGVRVRCHEEAFRIHRARVAQSNKTMDDEEEDVVYLGPSLTPLNVGSPVQIHSSYDDQTLTPPWIKKCDETQSQLIGLDKILQRLDANELKLEKIMGKIDMMIAMFQLTPNTSSASASSSSSSSVLVVSKKRERIIEQLSVPLSQHSTNAKKTRSEVEAVPAKSEPASNSASSSSS
jgi:hypothetical protein